LDETRDRAQKPSGKPAKSYSPPKQPDGKVNLSDPDSKLVHGMRGWVQGYNAQTVCNEQHLILAAEVMTTSPDFGPATDVQRCASRALPRV